MKFLKDVILFALFFYGAPAFSQRDTAIAGFTPKFNLITPLEGATLGETAFNISMEKNSGSHLSIELSVFHSNISIIYSYSSSYQYETKIISAFRYYYTQSLKHNGLYTGIYLDAIFLSGSSYTSSYSIPYLQQNSNVDALALGILTGYKVFLGKKTCLDVFIGLDLGKIFYTDVNTSPTAIQEQKQLILTDEIYGISIGYWL